MTVTVQSVVYITATIDVLHLCLPKVTHQSVFVDILRIHMLIDNSPTVSKISIVSANRWRWKVISPW